MNGLKRGGRAARKWQRLIDGQRESGMSVKAYCRKKKVPDSGFYIWRKRLSDRNIPENGFIQLPAPKAITPPAFEIQTPNGYSLKISSGLDEDLLTRVLGILRAS